jgi:Ca2+-binding EF-hand superfamily protein
MISEKKIIYSLNVEDVQTVALDAIERKLNNQEIKKVIKEVEKNIDWYSTIEDAINLIVEMK